jgi:hypothetical protein
MVLEQFNATYIIEPSNSKNAFISENDIGLSYDTTGEEHEFVLSLIRQGQQDRIWSVHEVDCYEDDESDDDESDDVEDEQTHFIGSGYAKVNVVAYIVTQKPATDADFSLEVFV